MMDTLKTDVWQPVSKHHAKLIGLLAPIAWPTAVTHCKDGAEQTPQQD